MGQEDTHPEASCYDATKWPLRLGIEWDSPNDRPGWHVTGDPPPLKWSDLRYVFDIKEDCNGKEAIQA